MVVDVSASGLEESQWRRSASGEVRLELRDGLVRGIDIRRILDEARAARDRLRGEDVKPVETTEEDQTRFSELNATVILGDGKARNDDLVVKAPLFRINGRGDADLVANRLDYRLDVHVVKTSKGQSGRELSELEGVNVPVAVTGPLESPAVAIDVASLLAEVLKSRTGVDRQALDQKEEEAREQLDRRIEEEKDDLRNRLMRELLE
jgi:AsmA protein